MKQGVYFFLGALTMLVVMLGYKFFTGNMLCFEKETVLPEATIETVSATTTPPVVSVDDPKAISLSPAQKEMLDSFGVDPSSVPSAISLEQEVCFREALGDARVAEILAGDTPSLLEIVQGKSCIE